MVGPIHPNRRVVARGVLSLGTPTPGAHKLMRYHPSSQPTCPPPIKLRIPEFSQQNHRPLLLIHCYRPLVNGVGGGDTSALRRQYALQTRASDGRRPPYLGASQNARDTERRRQLPDVAFAGTRPGGSRLEASAISISPAKRSNDHIFWKHDGALRRCEQRAGGASQALLV